MKTSSRLNLLILIAFLIAAVAFLIYRYVDFAEQQQKIYGATMPAMRVPEEWRI